MKIRAGFVSNSSSSSFIIHKSAFETNTKRLEFINTLENIIIKTKDEYGGSWNDCGQTYSLNGDFILVGTHYAPDEVFDACDKFISNKDSVYRIEG